MNLLSRFFALIFTATTLCIPSKLHGAVGITSFCPPNTPASTCALWYATLQADSCITPNRFNQVPLKNFQDNTDKWLAQIEKELQEIYKQEICLREVDLFFEERTIKFLVRSVISLLLEKKGSHENS